MAQSILGSLQGFSESDLEAGGRLERLSRKAHDENDRRAEREGAPEEAVGYYRTACAVSMILSNSAGHLRTSLSFAWRGIWASDTSSPVGDLVNLLLWTAFVVFVIMWLVKQRTALLASVVLPVGMLMFHALATHNLSRYNGPLIPFFVICFSLAVQAGLMYLNRQVAHLRSRSLHIHPQGGTY